MKNIIPVLIGAAAVLAGAVAAFIILKKKFGNKDDFDDFEDFDALDDDEFFDEDEFYGDEEDYNGYKIGSDNSMPFAGAKQEEPAEEEEAGAEEDLS